MATTLSQQDFIWKVTEEGYGQGYFFSKPLDNKAIEDLLATSQWER